jgi:hypothetical protein
MGLAKHPDLPNIPNAFDAVQSEEDKQVFKLIFAPWSYGRPVAAPPGLPLDRTETLRRAFQETMVDPAFLEEAKKLNIEVNPISHDEISRLLDELFRTPREVIERTRQVLEIEQR